MTGGATTCPRCGRHFASAIGLGVHQGRPGPCHDPDAIRARQRARERRYAERHPERRRAQLLAAQRRLRESGYQAAWRAAHPDRERQRRVAWRAANPELLRAQWARRSERRRVDRSPIPPSHTGHELFDHAWAILGRLGVHRDSHLSAIHDPGWEDVCSAAVLALVAGDDPELAARQALAAERRWRAVHLPLLVEIGS